MREHWATRFGLILAAAGNAIGIGNFLRFPSLAARMGGGAFIVPYIVSLLLFGIPLMWLVWWIGRYGGRYGHGSTPGMFDRLLPRCRLAKYLGVFGVAFPLIFCIYYTYAESWMLGYAWLSLTGGYRADEVTDYAVLLNEYTGELRTGNYFRSLALPLIAFGLTFGANLYVLYRGLSQGIEAMAKIAMPLLLLFAAVLAVRVLTLPPQEGTVTQGLAYVWVPDFSRLGDFSIWLAAAGQIFFTLSIGFGSLECYASYLREKEDVVLSGLTTASANEFAEVFFGSVIAIPATAVFLGAAAVPEVAGTFSIGMVAMPQVLLKLEPTWLFGTVWFLLLFLAAFMSSVAVAQPVMAFFQDELGWSRGKSAAVLGAAWLAGTLMLLWGMPYGMFEQFDFWAGTIALVVFALIEVILVGWIAGIDTFWEDVHVGAELRIPRVFRFVLKYVTPVCLLGILVGWGITEVAEGFPNLAPPPKLNVVQRNIESVKARVVPAAPLDGALRQRLIAMTDRDKHAAFRVHLAGDGRVRKMELLETSDADFAAVADEMVKRGRFTVTPNPVTPNRFEGWFEVLVETRHVTPMVWLARALMAASLAIFLILIAWTWKRRAAVEAERR